MRNYGPSSIGIRLPETLYHGTTSNHVKSIKESINLNACNEKADFGKGFYLTTNAIQAAKWALRKESVHNYREGLHQDPDNTPNFVKGVVIEYNVNHQILDDLKQKNFTHQDVEWADFIYFNRTSLSKAEVYSNRLDLSITKDLGKFSGVGMIRIINDIIDDNNEAEYDIIKGPLGDGKSIFKATHIRDNTPKSDSMSYLEGIKSKSPEFSSYDQVTLHTSKALRLIEYRKVVVASELLRSGMESHIHSKGD
ncbi:DUF3990 domain-containing protein [Bacillus sp. XT-2]|uniref:DUF3990 domain-containing protein n=1 Tax=Bacillus sp. XT-2 TaxID=2856852 RepID=UPI0021E1828B|nr:DUF3990 domain-containing protein [Bacillus sp. XT-2]MCV0024759.1 DUF3990 domain-containing protein [Bacillus sp. XT-2]